MLRKLVAWMRFDGLKPGVKTNPLKPRPQGPATPLAEAPFSPNPGNLRMLTYAPARLPRMAPLVVALHGCTQTAVRTRHQRRLPIQSKAIGHTHPVHRSFRKKVQRTSSRISKEVILRMRSFDCQGRVDEEHSP